MKMALNDLLPPYIQPCDKERNESLESFWYNVSDFGECFNQSSDSQLYPCLNPVYNGTVLKIKPELIHASLSGISIKHYYGKCYKDEEEEEFWTEQCTELYGSDLFDPEEKGLPEPTLVKDEIFPKSSTTIESLKYNESSLNYSEFAQPICTRSKINFRNSFWNIHQPELCKLTWSQKYVSTASVTEHLHDHLTFHGPLCAGYHEEHDRINMLNKELDDYVRLKEILPPKELPPDEKFFNFEMDVKKYIRELTANPKCRAIKPEEKKIINYKERNLNLSDDEEIEGKNVHISKEEFCLTIGKHIRKPPITTPVPSAEKNLNPPVVFSSGENEEGCGLFFYNWQLYGTEQSYEHDSGDESLTEREDDSDHVSLIDSCPPLMMDDFCRAVGKVDFSDLRCSPDDF